MAQEGGEGLAQGAQGKEGLIAKPDLERTRELLDSQGMPGVQKLLESLELNPIDGQQLVERTTSRFGKPGISVADSLKKQVEYLSHTTDYLIGRSWRGKVVNRLVTAMRGPYPKEITDSLVEEQKKIQDILDAWNSGDATLAQEYFSQANTAALERAAGWMGRIEDLEMDMRHSNTDQSHRFKGQAAEVVKSATDYLTTKSLLEEVGRKAQPVPPQPVGSPLA